MDIDFTENDVKQLRIDYEKAIAEGKDTYHTFMFKGNEYVVGFAKYLLEYLEPKMNITPKPK